MGRQAIISHSKGPKHIKLIELRKTQPNISFFKKKNVEDTTMAAQNKENSTLSLPKDQIEPRPEEKKNSAIFVQ